MNILKFAKTGLLSFFNRKAAMSNSKSRSTYKYSVQITPDFSTKDWSGHDYLFDKPKSTRKTHICNRGQVHNIREIFNRLNQEQLGGMVKARITFGRHGCKNTARRTNISFGSYSQRERLIRIHPALDSIDVPEFVIEHVIYHEMLHQIYEPQLGGGNKWIIHTDEFNVAETCGPSYEAAMEWLQKNYITVFFKKPNT